jgi:hypothetical protein
MKGVLKYFGAKVQAPQTRARSVFFRQMIAGGKQCL